MTTSGESSASAYPAIVIHIVTTTEDVLTPSMDRRGLLTGQGATPDAALAALYAQARETGLVVIKGLMDAPPNHLRTRVEAIPGSWLWAWFQIGTLRLTSGSVNGASQWVAYGTLAGPGSSQGQLVTVMEPNT